MDPELMAAIQEAAARYGPPAPSPPPVDEYVPPGTEYMRTPPAAPPPPAAHGVPARLPPSLVPGPRAAPPMQEMAGIGPGGVMAPAAAPAPAAPVRQGQTVPGGMLTDDGQMVPITAPVRRGMLPQHMGRGRPTPPPMPPEFHGGQYFPEGNDIELGRIAGKYTDPQARMLEQRRDAFQHTVPGIEARMMRQGLADEQANLDAMQPVFDAQGRELDARGDQLQRLEDFQASERLAQQERREVYERELIAQEDKYKLALQDIANSKIDPERLTRSTGQKIQRSIRGFLGALGAALLGRPNETAQDMAAEIERDIASQRENLANKRQGAEAQASILGIMRQRYGDIEQAQAAARQFYYEQLDSELQQTMNETASAEHKTRIGLLRDELGQRMQMGELDLRRRGQMRADEIARQRMLLMMQQRAPKKAIRGRDLDARFVPGLGLAPDAGRAKDMQATLRDAKLTTETANDLLGMLDRGGTSVPGMQREKVQAAAMLLLAQTNKGLGLGALDKGSQEVLGRIVSNPDELFSLNSGHRARLAQLQKFVQRKVQAEAQSLGFTPVRRSFDDRGATYQYQPGEDTNRTPTAARFKPVQ